MKSTISLTDDERSVVAITDDGAPDQSERLDLVLVVRILSPKKVWLSTLQNQMAQHWDGRFKAVISEHHSDLFLITFGCIGDKIRALEKEPWHFQGHHIVLLEPSALNSITPQQMIYSPFWVQAYRLPFLSKTQPLAKALGNLIGEFIEVFRSCFGGSRGNTLTRLRRINTLPQQFHDQQSATFTSKTSPTGESSNTNKNHHPPTTTRTTSSSTTQKIQPSVTAGLNIQHPLTAAVPASHSLGLKTVPCDNSVIHLKDVFTPNIGPFPAGHTFATYPPIPNISREEICQNVTMDISSKKTGEASAATIISHQPHSYLDDMDGFDDQENTNPNKAFKRQFDSLSLRKTLKRCRASNGSSPSPSSIEATANPASLPLG
uniref:DUF4283 domain-containing protein n=1 Tax=Cannabis sativa TaxID=3483 RepID=A0A803QC95_CANSA